ncbi:MAG: helix-turn-helix domain-containing protein [Fimbriimonadaceae bacterium]|nr:helix-turn-helix domain-containing protein [Alphaproteobacteria bacterium]
MASESFAGRVGDYAIGDVARLSGCKVQTVRYYEDTGLMPVPVRNAGNQRRYDRASLDRLKFIRHCRKLGFGLDAIRELLSFSEDPDRPCEAVDDLARKHLVSVNQRIEQLETLRGELNRMISECAGGTVSQCRIIEVLADHALCESEH